MTEAAGAKGRPPEIRLYHFAFSHYNEKVRWMLDYAGLPSTRVALLPGPHARVTQPRSGQSSTPLVEIDGEVFVGSAEIVERLDALGSDRSLAPTEPDARKQADEWIRFFDDEVGPAVRLSLFHRILEEPRFAAALFSTAQPVWKRVPYGWMLPRMVPMLRERMSIDDAHDREAIATIEAALERVAAAVGETGYLVGDRFTTADLTGASLLFPLGHPENLPFAFPRIASPAHDGWCQRWSGHPGVTWMLEMFRRHR